MQVRIMPLIGPRQETSGHLLLLLFSAGPGYVFIDRALGPPRFPGDLIDSISLLELSVQK